MIKNNTVIIICIFIILYISLKCKLNTIIKESLNIRDYNNYIFSNTNNVNQINNLFDSVSENLLNVKKNVQNIKNNKNNRLLNELININDQFKTIMLNDKELKESYESFEFDSMYTDFATGRNRNRNRRNKKRRRRMNNYRFEDGDIYADYDVDELQDEPQDYELQDELQDYELQDELYNNTETNNNNDIIQDINELTKAKNDINNLSYDIINNLNYKSKDLQLINNKLQTIISVKNSLLKSVKALIERKRAIEKINKEYKDKIDQLTS